MTYYEFRFYTKVITNSIGPIGQLFQLNLVINNIMSAKI